MTSCSGLPICLSGIQLFPQPQRPLSRRVRPHMQPRPCKTPTRDCMPERETGRSDCGASTLATTPLSGRTCDRGDAHEERNSEFFQNTSTWPRLALAQQMADLDCRREAVRRRSLQDRSHFMDYRVSPRQHELMAACLQSQAKPDEDSASIPKSICAKAA